MLNSELIAVDNWMKSNKLLVNIEKTSYIIFKPRQKKIKINLPKFKIKINFIKISYLR